MAFKTPRELVVDLLGWGCTQSQIAARVGTNQATISKIFRGKVDEILSTSYVRLVQYHSEVEGVQAPKQEA